MGIDGHRSRWNCQTLFFSRTIGNIRDNSLEEILNSKESIRFRKDLDMESNSTCVKCVCYLNLPPGASLS